MDELVSGDPRRIGPYQLEARLGSGGMGRVYLGRSPGGRHVAIKVIRPELAEDADFRARFAQEVAAARKVSGIYTASVVDADLDGPVPWLATSYVSGPSLAVLVAYRGPLPTASVLALAAGLAEGLAAIHAAGVVHRDLKPANVLLAEDGPRLIDFGISRSLEAVSLTRTGIVVGSPGFMSPEQADSREVGPPSDIFSLGAVLTFAATGIGPFGDGTTPALLYRVVCTQPNTSGLPGEIRPAIERCLAKDPRSRPTAAQLLAKLSTDLPFTLPRPEPGQGGFPGLGPPAPVPYRADNVPVLPTHLATERAAAYPDDAPAWGPTASALHPPLVGGPTLPPVSGPALPRVTSSPLPPDAVPPLPVVYDPRVVPPQRRRPFRPAYLIAVVAAAVLAAVAGAFVATKAGHVNNARPASASSAAVIPTPPVTSATTGSSPVAQSPGAATMAAIGSDLARSASVRPTVQPAIDGVQSCSVSPQSGESTLQQAISTRQDILTSLQTLSPSGVPNGAQLISSLETAMQDSISADEGYQSWMVDFANAGNPCGSNPGQDSNYAAGQDASNAATIAKNDFLASWNPIAPQYGQQTYSVTGF